jgi:hypothetical protein
VYADNNELKRLSWVVEYNDSLHNKWVGALEHFIRVSRDQQEYVLAGIVNIQCVPDYCGFLKCSWPPPSYPVQYVRVEQLSMICLVITLDGEVENGVQIAHVLKYIYKSTPDPRWWQKPSVQGVHL